MESRAKGRSAFFREHYQEFYAGAGWGTTPEAAAREVRLVANRLGWKSGRKVLDLGCGEGDHTDALRRLGFAAWGIDVSSAGIERARQRYPLSIFAPADAAEWEPAAQVDSIYCRGMSWFHYELAGINRHGIDVPHETARLFSWLRPGGEFVLQVSTDFSGSDSGGVLNNPLGCYVDLFRPLGRIVLLCDWQGGAVTVDQAPATGIVLAIRKCGE